MSDKSNHSLREATDFISKYVAVLMGSGVHTSRVIRNSCRIAESLGARFTVSIFNKNAILTMTDCTTGEHIVEIVHIYPRPIDFSYNSDLSALSWEAYDERLPLDVLKEKFEKIITTPRLNRYIVLLMVSLANFSFCRLFGGDWLSCVFVFFATAAGFSLRTQLQSRHVNHYIVFVLSALVASACASLSVLCDTTSDIAITTSVLFLIPGVPLINGVIDIVEGHILSGFSRLMNAGLLVICIAIGLAVTLMMVKNSLI